MGYTEALVGNAIRERLIEGRRERWRERLRGEHDLTDEELEALAPYIAYVSHYGSWKEFAALGLVFVPFVLILLGIMVASGGSSLALAAAVLTGQFSRVLVGIGLLAALTALLPVLLLGLIGGLLWRRWNRYTLATTVRDHLTTDPRRLCDGETPLPKSREEIAIMTDTTVAGG